MNVLMHILYHTSKKAMETIVSSTLILVHDTVDPVQLDGMASVLPS